MILSTYYIRLGSNEILDIGHDLLKLLQVLAFCAPTLIGALVRKTVLSLVHPKTRDANSKAFDLGLAAGRACIE